MVGAFGTDRSDESTPASRLVNTPNPAGSLGLHQSETIRTAGESLATARAAMIMVHGRGATAESILTLVPAFGMDGFAFLAPQAFGNTWYPNSFLAHFSPTSRDYRRGFRQIGSVMTVTRAAGISNERIILPGFSQGACLAIEYSARNPRTYGGIACLSGGLIGPDGTPRNYPGNLGNTPVFLGCSDVDPHVPAIRVRESAAIMTEMGASVTLRLYAGMGHLVNDDEIAAVHAMMTKLIGCS